MLPLPSLFQLGELVRVFGKRASGESPITGICFREGKVSYEVGGVFVDSEYVLPPLARQPLMLIALR